MGFPLYVTCCFSLAAFNILSFCLVFVSLIIMCLGVFHLEFILYGTLCTFWTWLNFSFSMLGKISTIISSKISHILSFSLLLGSYNLNVGAFDIVPEISETILSFLLHSALQQLLPPFYLPAHWFIFLLHRFCYWFLLEYFKFQ